MLPSNHFLFAVTFAAAASVGCACSRGNTATANAVGTAHTTAATVVGSQRHELLALVHTEDDDVDDTPRGVLVITGDVIDACPAVRDAKAPQGQEAMQWLYMMRAISGCEKTGKLGTLVLHGPSRPQVIAKYIFSRLGIPETKVELTQAPGQRSCADDDCSPEDVRVEVGLGDNGAVAL